MHINSKIVSCFLLLPTQAVHVVPGVTAREMCSYFWDVRYRMDWEFTIDQAPTVLEVCGDDTVVLHQVTPILLVFPSLWCTILL